MRYSLLLFIAIFVLGAHAQAAPTCSISETQAVAIAGAAVADEVHRGNYQLHGEQVSFEKDISWYITTKAPKVSVKNCIYEIGLGDCFTFDITVDGQTGEVIRTHYDQCIYGSLPDGMFE